MKIQTTTTYGGQKANETKGTPSRDGYILKGAFETEDMDLIRAFANEGLASLLYRGGASILNETLGVSKNTEVEYDSEGAVTVGETLETWFAAACPNKRGTITKLPTGVAVTMQIGRYTPGEDSAGPGKQATAMAREILDSDDEEYRTMMLRKLKCTADSSTETVTEACAVFLRSLRK